jgi:hypothetical protein
VMHVMTAGFVALRPKSLNVDVRPPALEFSSSSFDALYCVIARKKRLARVADGRVK